MKAAVSWDHYRLSGFLIVEDRNLTDTQVQITIVRPKGRGIAIHRKHSVRVPSRSIYRVGDTIFLHPEMMRELQSQIGQRINDEIESMARAALLGLY